MKGRGERKTYWPVMGGQSPHPLPALYRPASA